MCVRSLWQFGGWSSSSLAPEVGFEPTTNRLTADRSTTELLWIGKIPSIKRGVYVAQATGGSKRDFDRLRRS
jgi:hypothetical protein